MYFSTKFAALLFAVAASAADLAELSVSLSDEISLNGKIYTPPVVAGVCFTLPTEWQDRAQSVLISDGWTCAFHPYLQCEGTATSLTGQVGTLGSAVYDNIQSFVCNKA